MLIDHREEKGQAWLDRLPALLAACERQWELNRRCSLIDSPPIRHRISCEICAEGTSPHASRRSGTAGPSTRDGVAQVASWSL
jgi:hypothetical protein